VTYRFGCFNIEEWKSLNVRIQRNRKRDSLDVQIQRNKLTGSLVVQLQTNGKHAVRMITYSGIENISLDVNYTGTKHMTVGCSNRKEPTTRPSAIHLSRQILHHKADIAVRYSNIVCEYSAVR